MPSAVLIFNESSGTWLGQDDARGHIVDVLEGAGLSVATLDGSLSHQILRSRETPGDVVVVAGGDGTIRATIEAHRGRGRPIGILPGGTMNLLAVDYAIPEQLDQAAKVIAAGHVRPVDYGAAGDHLFLHTMFTGLPVRIGVHRERRRGSLGLLDRLRLAAHALTTLPRDPDLTLTATVDGEERTLTSPSFCLAIGTMEDELFPRPKRTDISGGKMTVFALHPHDAADVARMVLHGAMGQISQDASVDKLVVDGVRIAGPRRRMHVMADGEDALVALPVDITVRSGEVEILSSPQATAEKERA